VSDCDLLTSAFAFEEARRNITAKAPERVAAFESLAPELVMIDEPRPAQVAVAVSHGLPDKEAPILAGAITGRADALVTGDRMHFGHLFGAQVEGVRILRLVNVLEGLVD
jgi:predicted nucleic acid-binding protein